MNSNNHIKDAHSVKKVNKALNHMYSPAITFRFSAFTVLSTQIAGETNETHKEKATNHSWHKPGHICWFF